ncbi:MAG: phosphotransferase [Candidatus Thorarchaeota archaeon]
MSEEDLVPSSDAVRKKQRLKTILTTIGESLQPYFKTQIYEEKGERPSFISIENVISEEKGTSKSKVHFVTYYLNSDIGKHNVFLVVKFAADESRYNKEIKNYSILSEVPKNHPDIYMPEIIYKSPKNRCIIYEGIIGNNFRKSKMDDTIKHQLAGKTLAAIHGIETGNFSADPYKKLILYLLSTLENEALEQEILELMLPSFIGLEVSKGSTRIHGDFHQGNILFATDEDNQIIENNDVKIYIIDPEFITPGRDRAEDMGIFFAKPCIKEFQNKLTVEKTKNNFAIFVESYNDSLQSMGAQYDLFDLYPEGLTIDFHIASYLLYDISDKILSNNLTIKSTEIQQNLKLIRKLLEDKILSI